MAVIGSLRAVAKNPLSLPEIKEMKRSRDEGGGPHRSRHSLRGS